MEHSRDVLIHGVLNADAKSKIGCKQRQMRPGALTGGVPVAVIGALRSAEQRI
jgi:hypothetical protein